MSTYQEYGNRDLVLRIAKGDQEAFSQLIDLYSSRVFAHALAYLKRSDIAEEIAQDVMLTVWNRRKELEGITNFPGWLYVIARNKTHSAFRQMLKFNELPEVDAIDRQFQIPAESLEYKELSEIIQKGIEKLPPRRKQVFLLSRQAGLTYEEIAAQLGIGKSAVNQHIVEAIAFLRNTLQEELGPLFWVAIYMLPATFLAL